MFLKSVQTLRKQFKRDFEQNFDLFLNTEREKQVFMRKIYF
jgi:hypothetical protein